MPTGAHHEGQELVLVPVGQDDATDVEDVLDAVPRAPEREEAEARRELDLHRDTWLPLRRQLSFHLVRELLEKVQRHPHLVLELVTKNFVLVGMGVVVVRGFEVEVLPPVRGLAPLAIPQVAPLPRLALGIRDVRVASGALDAPRAGRGWKFKHVHPHLLARRP